jgi:hypothetical protein
MIDAIKGKALDEARLFQIAHAYEQSTDWHKQQPPVPTSNIQRRINPQSAIRNPQLKQPTTGLSKAARWLQFVIPRLRDFNRCALRPTGHPRDLRFTKPLLCELSYVGGEPESLKMHRHDEPRAGGCFQNPSFV